MFILMLYLLSLPFAGESVAAAEDPKNKKRQRSLSILPLQHKSGHEKVVEMMESSNSKRFDYV